MFFWYTFYTAYLMTHSMEFCRVSPSFCSRFYRPLLRGTCFCLQIVCCIFALCRYMFFTWASTWYLKNKSCFPLLKCVLRLRVYVFLAVHSRPKPTCISISSWAENEALGKMKANQCMTQDIFPKNTYIITESNDSYNNDKWKTVYKQEGRKGASQLYYKTSL